MTQKVFFSWQADTPPRIGRNFLKDVLDDVCKEIASDVNVDEAMRDVEVDSDTQGVPGQPPIVETIFKKIDAAAVFVPDMTFVAKRDDGRLSPNPNVLIEYGWALKSLTHTRFVSVMNTAFGRPSHETLPFDLRHVRWPICYHLPEDCTQETKNSVKKQLVSDIKKAVQTILATIPSAPANASLLFEPKKSLDGPARFRKRGEALGVDMEPPFGTNKEVFLSEGPSMWLRLMPLNNPQKTWPIHKIKEAASANNSNLLPLVNGAGGYSFILAADGYGMFKTGSQTDKEKADPTITIQNVAFAFETSEIWSVDTILLSWSTDHLPYAEKYYLEAIRRYADFLHGIGVKLPYKWIAGISGIKGRHFDYPVRLGYSRLLPGGPVCTADMIEVEGEWQDGQNAVTVLVPFFDKIFDKCGLARPDYLPK